jgi:hypothetical protein
MGDKPQRTSIFLAIALCGVSVFGKYWLDHKIEWWNHDVDDRINVALNARVTSRKLLAMYSKPFWATDATVKTLTPFIHNVLSHQFESASKLPTDALQQRLPAIQHLLTTAKDRGVKTDSKLLDVLTRGLKAVNSSAVGFWPTAAE